MKSSLSIWHYVVSVKSTVKISSIFVAFLKNTNVTKLQVYIKINQKSTQWKSVPWDSKRGETKLKIPSEITQPLICL